MKLTKEYKLAIAKRARKLIKKGWTKGTWEGKTWKGNPTYCLEGACNQAAIDVLGEKQAVAVGAAFRSFSGEIRVNSDPRFTRRLSVTKAARKYAKEKFGIVVGSANAMNDNKKTRKADVVAVLDNYIAELEEA